MKGEFQLHHRGASLNGERQGESPKIKSVIHPFALNHSQPGLLKPSGRDTVPAVEQLVWGKFELSAVMTGPFHATWEFTYTDLTWGRNVVCAGLLSPPPAQTSNPRIQGKQKLLHPPKVLSIALSPFVFATITVWTLAGAIHTLWVTCGMQPGSMHNCFMWTMCWVGVGVGVK